MDIEYHYHITCLIAKRAGFSDEEAFKIGYSSQYTDDNNRLNKIYFPNGTVYENYISQTLNILKPKKELLRIHPCFHFFPGTEDEVVKSSLPRKDGKLHLFNTIPNNLNARTLMQTALRSQNLYRIGIATHTFADTFAHQNFVGFEDSFNSMKGLLEKLIPNIGHADAKHAPDWPAMDWEDGRIVTKHKMVDNKKRFLQATDNLFTIFRSHIDPQCSKVKISRDKNKLLGDLDIAIGKTDKQNLMKNQRIQKYLALTGDGIKDYRKGEWLRKAVKKEYKDVVQGEYIYRWKDENYKDSDWYTFQEAVKEHQKSALEILRPIFEKTELVAAPIW